MKGMYGIDDGMFIVGLSTNVMGKRPFRAKRT